jgi:2-iminoacetate synthase
MVSFIPEAEIEDLLERAKKADSDKVAEIIKKSRKLKGLSPEDVAYLLQCTDKAQIEAMFETARAIKEAIYGKRLVFFAPLYVTNECINNCLYCAFRVANRELKRKTLSLEEIKNEVKILEAQGHKRILLVAGEHPKCGIDYLEAAIREVYKTINERSGEIRRVNVNAAPMSVNDFKRLKAAGIGTYQLFQETYHYETYKEMHQSGPKADYFYRLSAMDRAQEAGIDDVGIGVLFGLYDYKFEVLALLYHALHLEEKFGVGPHTISVPRIEPALGAPIASAPPYPVSDFDFKKLVAIIRMAVPYTGMILSTREPPQLRHELFKLGISQISAGSSTAPGGYTERSNSKVAEQFSIGDHRPLHEIVKAIIKDGYYPSFCTACYRVGRTGKDFMALAKPGLIKKFCTPNSLLTFEEYMLDYGDDETKRLGEKLIKKQLKEIKDKKIKQLVKKKLEELKKGKRDLFV